jgi:glycosyltransferase involved in cell wall biosynthesis
MSAQSADTPQTSGRDMHVIVAAYNEASRIEATLAALTAAFPGALMWVADDGSTDATELLARRAGARVVRSERMVGKGAAATLAARAALRDAEKAWNARARTYARVPDRKSNVSHDREGAEPIDDGIAGDYGPIGDDEPFHDAEPIFILCDGDLAESASRLGALAGVVGHGDADMAVAAFATRVGGGVGLAVAFARWAIRRRCGLETQAPISGQRALRASVLADVLPFAAGFGMEIGITIDAARAGHRIAEVELDLSHRATGRTLSGFAHRGRQLVDFVRVYIARR